MQRKTWYYEKWGGHQASFYRIWSVNYHFLRKIKKIAILFWVLVLYLVFRLSKGELIQLHFFDTMMKHKKVFSTYLCCPFVSPSKSIQWPHWSQTSFISFPPQGLTIGLNLFAIDPKVPSFMKTDSRKRKPKTKILIKFSTYVLGLKLFKTINKNRMPCSMTTSKYWFFFNIAKKWDK